METFVLDIQTCSVHDGPGLRTTVFLKGCPLTCKWCHNPESQSFRRQLKYQKARCILCGECVKVCSAEVHRVDEGTHEIQFEKCEQCGKCVTNCKGQALTRVGESMTIDQIMAVVREDVPFYHKSGGGITVSGGEPLSHPNFVKALLQQCQSEGIHTCVETSGYGSLKALEAIGDYVDLFLLDYKVTGEEAHKQYTGVSYEPIRRTLEWLEQEKKTVILRCPIIPTVNDEQEHFEAIKAIKEKYRCVLAAELMPYHDLGVSKARQVGMSQEVYKQPTQKQIEESYKLI